MRIFALILLFTAGLWACSGDCLKCHATLAPTIEQDKDHRVMLECIRCHEETDDKFGACGADCWDCHDPEKVAASGVEIHKVLTESCMKCHFVRKTLFDHGSGDGLGLSDLLGSGNPAFQ